MKMVVAYIQPHRLNEVKQELYKKGIYKISITNAMGCGQQMGYNESWRGINIEVNLLKKVRIEIALNDPFVQPAIDAIIAGARSGNIGDGKIFVFPIADCIRIRSRETGEDAIG